MGMTYKEGESLTQKELGGEFYLGKKSFSIEKSKLKMPWCSLLWCS
jgi:hypothetical protein